MKSISFFPIAIILLSQSLSAQDSVSLQHRPSVSIEEVVGDKRQFLQLMVNKVFTKKQAGIFSISSYAADYKDNPGQNEFQNTTLIYHPIYKGIGIHSGVNFTSIDGLRNFIGLQYMIQKKSFSFLYLPSYLFSRSRKFSNLAMLEFTPSLQKNWSLYARVQGHYNYDLKTRDQFRSYVYTRLGLSYNYFSFGLAHNYDRYGADKMTRNNYGVFLKLSM